MKSIRISISVWWNSMTTLEKVLLAIKAVLLITICVSVGWGNFSSWGWYRLIIPCCFTAGYVINACEVWHEKRGRAIYYLCIAAVWLITSVLLILPPF